MSNLYLKEALTYFKTKCDTFFCKKQDIINNAISTNTDKPVSAAVATNLQGQITELNNNLAVTGAHNIWATVPATSYWGDFFVFLPMFNAASIKSVSITSVLKKSGNAEADLTSSFTFYTKTRDGILLKTKDTSCAGALCAFTITVS